MWLQSRRYSGDEEGMKVESRREIWRNNAPKSFQGEAEDTWEIQVLKEKRGQPQELERRGKRRET